MYQFNSVLARFPSTYPKQHFHPNKLLRSLSFQDSSSEVVPPERLGNMLRLSCESTAQGGVCDVYVLGTQHFSQKSCQEVKTVVNILKPQVVFLELCSRRSGILQPNWQDKMMTSGFVNCCYLHLIKVFYNTDKLESEFRVAFEEGKKCGAKFILGDQPIKVTFERYRRKMGKMHMWHSIKLLFHVLFQYKYNKTELWQLIRDAIENNNGEEFFTLMTKELRQYFPVFVDTMLDERDQYMSAMLLKVASEHNSVVAVVGKGHLPGIQKCWKQNIEGRSCNFDSFQELRS